MGEKMKGKKETERDREPQGGWSLEGVCGRLNLRRLAFD